MDSGTCRFNRMTGRVAGLGVDPSFSTVTGIGFSTAPVGVTLAGASIVFVVGGAIIGTLLATMGREKPSPVKGMVIGGASGAAALAMARGSGFLGA